MALGLYPNIPNQGTFIKPRGHLILNQDHPLVQRKAGLILAYTASEYDGYRIFDLAQGYPEIVPGASTHAKWTSGRGMPAFDFTGGAKEVRFVRKTGLPTIANATAAWTAVAVVYPTANSGQIFSIFDASGNNAIGIGIDSTNHLCDEQASAPDESSTLTVPLNHWHIVGLSQSGASARVYMVDGQTQATTGTVAANAIPATNPYLLGRFYSTSTVDTTSDYKGMIEMILVWNTALTTPQLKSFASNPYQIFQSQTNRLMFMMATPAGGAATHGLFRQNNMSGLGVCGPYFQDPMSN